MQQEYLFDDVLTAPVMEHPRDLPRELNADEQAYAEAVEGAFTEDEQGKSPTFEQLNAIGTQLIAEFNRAALERRETEQRWLKDLRQYKGKYDPEVLSGMDKDRSKAFVRKTRVKVKTVDARITDLLFPANSQRNWSIEPTPSPSMPEEQRAEVKALLAKSIGEEPTEDQIEEAVRQACAKAAKKMAAKLDDQLVEARYKATAKKVIHSGNLYGTGVLKAPLVERKVRQRFVKEKVEGGGPNVGKYRWVMKTEQYIAPFVDYVPLWHFYPDMSATELNGCRYVYELHPMTRTDLLDLAKRNKFNTKAIHCYIEANPDGLTEARDFDVELRAMGDREATEIATRTGRYDVLERWGWMDGKSLCECGVDVPDDRKIESFFTNIWLLPDGQVIKASIQPIAGVLWPYHLYYLDKDETSIFGEGIATIMRDDQDMLNASVRMMLDNAAITAGPQIEANTGLLHPGQDPKQVRPFKVWTRTNEDAPSPALRVYNIPNSLGELGQLASMFETNADETTAVPRYVTGENVTTGAAGTASGLSMLMGNSSIVFKDQVSNYDEGVTVPFITALYRWNMQFSRDDDIKGDYDVKATGAASLVAKEVRAAQLQQFGMSTANDLDAPYIKRDELNRQRAEALDLVNVVKTKEEVEAEQNNQMAQMQQQLVMQQQQLAMAQAQAAMQKMLAEAQATMRKAEQAMAEVARVQAMTTGVNIENARKALETGALASTNPNAAAAGDEILAHAEQQVAQAMAAQQQAAAAEQAPPEQGAPAEQMPPEAMQ